ncbi:hypothetical protein ABTF07_21080, partial [Acinetobacter baumannii]
DANAEKVIQTVGALTISQFKKVTSDMLLARGAKDVHEGMVGFGDAIGLVRDDKDHNRLAKVGTKPGEYIFAADKNVY